MLCKAISNLKIICQRLFLYSTWNCIYFWSRTHSSYSYNIICRHLCVMKVWLESDFTYVVTFYHTRSLLVRWRWYFALVDRLEKIIHMNFHYSYNFREGNVVANYIAPRTLSICTTIWWWDASSFTNAFIYINNRLYYLFYYFNKICNWWAKWRMALQMYQSS